MTDGHKIFTEEEKNLPNIFVKKSRKLVKKKTNNFLKNKHISNLGIYNSASAHNSNNVNKTYVGCINGSHTVNPLPIRSIAARRLTSLCNDLFVNNLANAMPIKIKMKILNRFLKPPKNRPYLFVLK